MLRLGLLLCLAALCLLPLIPPPAADAQEALEPGSGTITQKAPDKYELVLPDSPDKIDITTDASRVGARLYRWGEECWVDVSMPFTATTLTAVQDNKVTTADSKVELNLYGTEAYGNSAFEFEIILKEQPLTNQIVLDIASEGLNFYYQPPLTEQYTDGWSDEFQDTLTVTETEVRNSKGEVVVSRPEHVVGSYAVYHATKKGHVLGQTNYMAGKAFHIYRPQLIDAIGAKVWAEQVIENGKQIITIPQKFLDEATYPIRHAAGDTFGQTAIGQSAVAGPQDRIMGSDFAGAAGEGVSITVYNVTGTYDGGPIRLGLYEKDTPAPFVMGTGDESSPTNGVNTNSDASGWNTLAFTAAPTLEAIDYFIVQFSEEFSYAYDAGAGRGFYYDVSYPASWPTPITFGAYGDHIFSIYCTYTPSGGGPSLPTVETVAASSVEETTATLNGNITATGDENLDTRGFVWDTVTRGDPGNATAPEDSLYANYWTEDGDYGTGTFNHGITALTKGDLYYFRAAGNNSAGWDYGDELKFITKPDEPTGLTDTAHTNSTIDIEWTKGDGADNSIARYDTSGYPADKDSGTSAYNGAGDSTQMTTLAAGQIHYIRVWSHATEGGENSYSDTYAQDTAYTSPGNCTNFDASNPTSSSIDIEWTMGTGGDKTMVRYKTGSYPTGPADGDQVYFDTGNSTTVGTLDANTLYYFSVYGYDTDSGYYSDGADQDTETTLAGVPTLTTSAASSVEETTATLNGEITNTGGQNLSHRGFAWDTTSRGNPGNATAPEDSLYANYWTESGSFGTGAFNHGITALTKGELYYVRGAGNNSAGWDYGDELKFLTKPDEPTGLTDTAHTASTIDIEWTTGAGADNSIARYDTGGYPADKDSGTSAYNGAGNSTQMTTLAAGQIHYIRVWSHATEGGENSYSDTYSQDTAYTSPGNCTNFDASNPSVNSIDLSWTKGTGGDKTMVRGKIGSYPTDPADGDQVYFDTGVSTTHNGLGSSEDWYYRAWGYDTDSGYYSDDYDEDLETTLASANPPTVVTNAATNVLVTTATLNGDITATGGENADIRGFVWDTTSRGDPGNATAPADTLYVNYWTQGGSFGTGAFTHGATLSGNTTYYVRAAAHNTPGWAYGNETSFTTDTAAPPSPALPGPPTNLTITETGVDSVRIEWTMGTLATMTMVRINTGGYPTSIDEGYEVYFGTDGNCTDTGLSLEVSKYYVSAWSWNDQGYSTTYATATVGGEGMDSITISLMLAAFIGVAAWRRSMILWFAAIVAVAIMWPFWMEINTQFAAAMVVLTLGLGLKGLADAWNRKMEP